MTMKSRDGHESRRLVGANVLVVEDELLLLLELDDVLRAAGAANVRRCRDVKDALASIEKCRFTVAILDVRLRGLVVTPVARRLAASGTPFLFYTGQIETDPILAEWPGHPIVSKPASAKKLVQELSDLLERVNATQDGTA
jgi:DNA-binding response OmpR family regulator